MLTRSPPPSRSWSRKTSVAVIAPSRLTSTIRRCSALLGGERRQQHHAGVVDEDVDAAELVAHARGGREQRLAVGDVGRDGDRAVAELVGQRPRAIGATGQQRDAIAGGGQRAGGGFADARRGAGDDRDAAGGGLGAHGWTPRNRLALAHCARGWTLLRGPVRGAPGGPLSGDARGLPSGASTSPWTPPTTSPSSSPAGARRARPSRPAYRATASGGCRACGARRWRRWPASAPTTTGDSNAGRSAARRNSCS